MLQFVVLEIRVRFPVVAQNAETPSGVFCVLGGSVSELLHSRPGIQEFERTATSLGEVRCENCTVRVTKDYPVSRPKMNYPVSSRRAKI